MCSIAQTDDWQKNDTASATGLRRKTTTTESCGGTGRRQYRQKTWRLFRQTRRDREVSVRSNPHDAAAYPLTVVALHDPAVDGGAVEIAVAIEGHATPGVRAEVDNS